MTPMTESKLIAKETLLTPRFYTTDFKEISELQELIRKLESPQLSE